ncbi:MAG: YkgJ family cysteine cluster protein, partial [Methyloceanibacter sp.]
HPRLLARGVPLIGSEQLAQSMALLFKDCLENRSNKRRVLRAAEIAHQLYDQGELAAPSARPLGCKPGCDHCCYTFVSLLAPEALLLAERLKLQNEKSDRPSAKEFRAKAILLRGLDQRARVLGKRRACPILEEHLCSLHADRPLSCRKHTSFSAEACVAALRGEDVPIPAHIDYLTLGTTVSVTFRAALKSLGYSLALYELSEAVSTVLDTEDALRRWTEGEDIFAGVQSDTTTPAHLSVVIANLARAIS